MLQQFHDGMQGRMQDNSDMSESLPVFNRVKQGCVLAVTIFSLMFSAMLTDAFRDDDIGCGIGSQTHGKLFNLRWFQAKT